MGAGLAGYATLQNTTSAELLEETKEGKRITVNQLNSHPGRGQGTIRKGKHRGGEFKRSEKRQHVRTWAGKYSTLKRDSPESLGSRCGAGVQDLGSRLRKGKGWIKILSLKRNMS